jgi:MoxR-like ATPase
MDINPREMKPKLDSVFNTMGRVIVANPYPLRYAFVGFVIGRPVIATSFRGRGKTALGQAFEYVMEPDGKTYVFIRIQCTPQLMPSEIIGEKTYDEEKKKYVVLPSKAINAKVVLPDEVNRAGEETQAAYMELCENQGVTIDGVFYPLPKVNLWIFTRNPDGQVGPIAWLTRCVTVWRWTSTWPSRPGKTCIPW